MSQKLTLNQISAELSKLWFFIDQDHNGDLFALPDDELERLTTLGEALPQKVDNWIQFLESLTAEVAVYKERRDKASSLMKSREAAISRMKEYLARMIEQNPNIVFTGDLGTLKVRVNPPALKHDYPTRRWSSEHIVTDDLISERPYLAEYVEEITVRVLKTADIKDALKRGATYRDARLEQTKSVRW
jgi:hypothetical protein